MTNPQPWTGLTVVVTGEVSGLDRDQAKDAVTRLGGKPSGSVSARTDLIVAGSGAGVSKIEKARQHRTPTLDAEAFLSVISDPDSWNPNLLIRSDPEPKTPDVAREPRRVPTHAVGSAVIYPSGKPEIRLSCRCGHRWLGTNIHEAERGCPQDPDLAGIFFDRTADSIPV